MTEITFTLSDVERLAATLDGVDLDDKNRATLHTIFALAGQVLTGESDAEVSGFSFHDIPGISPGLLGSFQGTKYKIPTEVPIAFAEGDPDRRGGRSVPGVRDRSGS